jgi:sugar lactone lactonase YvrE
MTATTKIPLLVAWLALALIASARALAVPPLPLDKRVAAQVTSHLAAPTTQPMRMPNAVAIDSKGDVFVADGAQDRIVRFTADGQFERFITKVGTETMDRPVGMKVDSTDRLWIADTGNHRILIAAPDGKLAEKIALPIAPSGQPCDPTDVALTPDGQRCYVVDMRNHRILIRDNASGQFTAMGAPGRAAGQFEWPFMACIGDEKYFFVTEAIGARVQVISPTDKWAGVIGSWGIELGQLYRPKGIAADQHGRLYISDSTTDVVQVFSQRGSLQGALTDAAGNLLRFEHPMGLCFDSAGRLYVVELTANRVAVVTLDGTGPATRPTTTNGARAKP